MKRRLLSERTLTNLQALIALVGFAALLVAVPHRLLRPLSVAFVLLAVVGVCGVRAWKRRLRAAEAMLTSNPDSPVGGLLAAMLTPFEQRLVGLSAAQSGPEAVARLRDRQSTLTSVGMTIAVPGLCAFLVFLFFYAA